MFRTSNLLFLLGLIMLLFYWPIGLLLIVAAVIFWAVAKGQPKTSLCPGCGNPVATTASICPTCHGTLTPSTGPLAPTVAKIDPAETDCPVCGAKLGLVMGGAWGCPYQNSHP